MLNTLAKSRRRYLGPLCVGILAFPFLYEYSKELYWTLRLKKLNMDEIISDRFTWLHHSMIKDEIDRTLLKQAPTKLKDN
ncbi:putative integral membrane protein [Theileria parva strain Muguga]|uniref:putative integral membrane protein n=1 Tax=Theileria parva strain Muguga TaxID=333668 RepID=UPI001C61B4A6|nr:putative integral membrane protein [Theileria parva strain Muguga]KAF5153261.1 putative integral membrane protein [Theileria parva strain Muguga]